MKEENIINFFAQHGFGVENNMFIGSDNYAFLPFNGSLIVGRHSKEGLLVEGIFKDSWIRKLIFDAKNGQVLIDVKEDPKAKPLDAHTKPLKPSLNDDEKPLEEET